MQLMQSLVESVLLYNYISRDLGLPSEVDGLNQLQLRALRIFFLLWVYATQIKRGIPEDGV